jgi:hypothetical protein
MESSGEDGLRGQELGVGGWGGASRGQHWPWALAGGSCAALRTHAFAWSLRLGPQRCSCLRQVPGRCVPALACRSPS